MTPEVFPILVADDILISEDEYEEGDRKTTVGWLKYLFLWVTEGDYLVTTDKDRKDYEQAAEVFRKVNGLRKGYNLHDYEDSTKPRQQAAALNKLRRELGYTVTGEEMEIGCATK